MVIVDILSCMLAVDRSPENQPDHPFVIALTTILTTDLSKQQLEKVYEQLLKSLPHREKALAYVNLYAQTVMSATSSLSELGARGTQEAEEKFIRRVLKPLAIGTQLAKTTASLPENGQVVATVKASWQKLTEELHSTNPGLEALITNSLSVMKSKLRRAESGIVLHQ